MNTQLELDINAVDLDNPVEKQVEILKFLGNPQPEKESIVISRENVYKLLEISKGILRRENPNWKNSKILASLSCNTLAEVIQDDGKVFYAYKQGFSDSDRFYKLQSSIQNQPTSEDEIELFNRVIDWLIQGIFYLYPHLAEVSSDCLDCEFEAEFRFFLPRPSVPGSSVTAFSSLPANFTGMSNNYHYCNGKKNEINSEGNCVRCQGSNSCSCS